MSGARAEAGCSGIVTETKGAERLVGRHSRFRGDDEYLGRFLGDDERLVRFLDPGHCGHRIHELVQLLHDQVKFLTGAIGIEHPALHG